MSHSDHLSRIIERCRGMTLADVDFDLVVIMSGNPHASIMYQAARNLDVERANGQRIIIAKSAS